MAKSAEEKEALDLRLQRCNNGERTELEMQAAAVLERDKQRVAAVRMYDEKVYLPPWKEADEDKDAISEVLLAQQQAALHQSQGGRLHVGGDHRGMQTSSVVWWVLLCILHHPREGRHPS